MARETKQDLQDRIDSLMKENERLIQDKKDYFIMRQNAELEADRLKEQLSGTEQLQYERDELLREVDDLRAELEATKAKLKEARATANKFEHALNDLKRRHNTVMDTNDMMRYRLARYEQEHTDQTATAASVPKIAPIMEQPQNPRRGRPSKVTPDQRQRVTDLHAAGGSVRTIARDIGLSIGTVQRIIHGQ